MSEFGAEQFVDLSVRIVLVEQSYELVRGITLVHIQGEQTAIFTADCTTKTL
jgi:hypothetical protein